MASFRLTPDAIKDLDAIWSFIFRDSPDAADAVEAEIKAACALLAEGPLREHVRRDLTKLPLRFWTLPRYPSYMIVYRPDVKPLEILRILHGGRNVKRILGQRS
jgi:plasmid stabilization system protein ParE